MDRAERTQLKCPLWEDDPLGMAILADCGLLEQQRIRCVAERAIANERVQYEIDERARARKELRQRNKKLRQLARQLIEVQENERRRLSRALHDQAGQALTALKIHLDLLEEDLHQGDLEQDTLSQRALVQRVADAAALAEATLEQIRALAQGLRPPALDAAGLNPTLEGFCRHFSAQTRIPILYRGTEPPILPEAARICLYRVLQESLTNVAKHAGANRVDVVLSFDARAVRLSVQDDGRGFDDSARLIAQGWPMGIGLLGMRERLEALGGRLEIASRPGQGARLVAHIPVQEA